MFGIEDHILKMIVVELSKYKEICDAIIFGSRAKGNFKRGSDIDIALKGKEISSERVILLKTVFNQKLLIPYHVDIIHYDSISNADLKNHIDRIGISVLHL